MYIERDEIRTAHKLFASHLTRELDDFAMIKPNGRLDLKDVHFLKGNLDWQEFMHTEPDPYAYEQFDTRTLYEILISIDKGKIPARELVISGIRHSNLVDLDSMIEDRTLMFGLQFMSTKIEWETNSKRMTAEQKATENLLDQFRVDLLKLCKDDYGVEKANQIWKEYGTRLPMEKPELTVSRRNQWFLDNKPRPVSGFSALKGSADGINIIGMDEWEEVKRTMVKLGSRLDFNEVEQFRVSEGQSLLETQKFGKLGKPDFLDIKWNIGQGGLSSYEAVLRRHIEIPGLIVGGINLKKLEGKMVRADWNQDWYPAAGHQPVRNARDKALVDSIARDFDKITNDKVLGEFAKRLLGLKFIAYTVNGHILEDVERLKAFYEQKMEIRSDNLRISPLEMYNLLDGRSVLKNTGQAAGSDWQWFSVDKGRRTEDGGHLLSMVQHTGQFNLLQELTLLGVRHPYREDMEALAAGSKVMLPVEIYQAKADRIFYADPQQKRLIIDKEEGAYYGLYRVPDAELYRSPIAKANEFLPRLLERAESMGIDSTNLSKISEEIITRGRTFTIEQDKLFGGDLIRSSIEIGKIGGPDFQVLGIKADLRPGIPTSEGSVNEVYISGLISLMEKVDWGQDFAFRASQDFHSNHPAGNKEMLGLVKDINADLKALFNGEDALGKEISSALALRYLKGTSNELLLSPELLTAMRNREKTVFFPGKPEFSLESLYNLMNDRFAMGQRYDITGAPAERQWYRVNNNPSGGLGMPSIILVPGKFSVEEALRHDGIMEGKMPGIVKILAVELEKGNTVAAHARGPKATIPMHIYADPLTKTVQVDLKKTFGHRPHISGEQKASLSSLPLKEFMTAVEKAKTNKAVSLHVLEIVAKKAAGPGDDTNRSQGKGWRQ